MLISQRWLKEFTDFDCEPQELAEILTMLGLEVENIHNPAAGLKGFVVGKVLEREKHPNASKLSVCRVEVATDTVQTIVCGAPNVDTGQYVPVALEGAIVPAGGFVIGKRTLRGVESNGMICSKAELEMGEDSDGIWILAQEQQNPPITTGTPLAEYLALNDVIYEISLTPDRADCLSHLGIAREIAAWFSRPLRIPEVPLQESSGEIAQYVTVQNDDPEVCWRFAAKVIRDVVIQPSPEWMQQRLIACGMRPINAVVDVTNYIMLECGKPIHAYDLDTVKNHTLIVRRAKPGEQLTTLDNKSRTLDDTMTLNADPEQGSGLGGIMGGQVSEISDTTVNVCIESALWHPSFIRRTAKKLGITSEAAYRHERGVDPEIAVYAAQRAAQLIAQYAGGTIIPGLIDDYPRPQKAPTISVRYERASMLIGIKIPAEQQRELVQRLGFAILHSTEEQMTVVVPSYRLDVFAEVDVIEEIARLFGYDNVQPQMSSGITIEAQRTPEALQPLYGTEVMISHLLANGFQEILTQNMIDPASAAYHTETPVRLKNPLGEELSCMRPSLIPSMLKVIAFNQRFGQSHVRLFELGSTFAHTHKEQKTTLEGFAESRQIIVALTGNRTGEKHWSERQQSADFYDIKGVLENLFLVLRYSITTMEAVSATVPMFSADCLEYRYNGQSLGWAGEVATPVLQHYGIEQPVFLALLNLSALRTIPRQQQQYESVSPYPSVVRDLAFIVDKDLSAGVLQAAIKSLQMPIFRDAKVFDVFFHESLGSHKKSIALTLTFTSLEKTLADKEVEVCISTIITTLTERFGAVLRQ